MSRPRLDVKAFISFEAKNEFIVLQVVGSLMVTPRRSYTFWNSFLDTSQIRFQAAIESAS